MALNKQYFTYTNKIKLGFVNALRYAFKSTLVPDIYKYDDIFEKSQIAIFRDFPRRVRKFPLLLVKANSADASIKLFNEEEIAEIVNQTTGLVDTVEVRLIVNLPITITIMAESTTDRERLTDLIVFFVRAVFRNRFAQEDISYTNISIGGENQETINEKVIYTNSITIDCYAELTENIDYTVFVDINKIHLFVDDTEKVTEHSV